MLSFLPALKAKCLQKNMSGLCRSVLTKLKPGPRLVRLSSEVFFFGRDAGVVQTQNVSLSLSSSVAAQLSGAQKIDALS